jgi:hypothetical protein
VLSTRGGSPDAEALLDRHLYAAGESALVEEARAESSRA